LHLDDLPANPVILAHAQRPTNTRHSHLMRVDIRRSRGSPLELPETHKDSAMQEYLKCPLG